jgi:hypothetical protein
MAPVERLLTEQFMAKKTPEKLLALYDSMWACYEEHEKRLAAVERRDQVFIALIAASASVIGAAFVFFGMIVVGG